MASNVDGRLPIEKLALDLTINSIKSSYNHTTVYVGWWATRMVSTILWLYSLQQWNISYQCWFCISLQCENKKLKTQIVCVWFLIGLIVLFCATSNHNPLSCQYCRFSSRVGSEQIMHFHATTSNKLSN